MDKYIGTNNLYIMMLNITDIIVLTYNVNPKITFSNLDNVNLQIFREANNNDILIVDRIGDGILAISDDIHNIINFCKNVSNIDYKWIDNNKKKTVKIRFKIGLHYGEVYGGRIKVDSSGDKFTVAGLDINLTARLENMSFNGYIATSYAMESQMKINKITKYKTMNVENRSLKGIGDTDIIYLKF